MDDRRIEELLRDDWQPQPPDGMRERVMNRARGELLRERSRPTILGMNRWSAVLAALGIVLIILTNVSDHARHSRIAAMMGSDTHRMAAPHPDGKTLFELRRELDDLLASLPQNYRPSTALNGGESQ